ncbi:MAG: hypothetical protein IT342_11450 [Candidatus Melainabacteria bacterium]|nr:hypothetical protein [Candidatus Melainabacteria bacterium]
MIQGEKRVKMSISMGRYYFAVLPLLALQSLPASAYPEFQQFVEENSHRTVNCAMCHVNENGPVGNSKGQIGSFTPDEMKLLNQARAAIDPGVKVESPILNQFGNEIIKAIGKKTFVKIKSDPGRLAELLPQTSDLDGDGIPDAKEYLDGTDPLNKFHGDPGKLFFINLDRYKMHIILAIVAVLSLNYGLIHLINGISILQAGKSAKD